MLVVKVRVRGSGVNGQRPEIEVFRAEKRTLRCVRLTRNGPKGQTAGGTSTNLRILHHLSPIALERGLLACLDAEHPRVASARTLVLTPTSRLADHVQRRATALRPGWLGLRVVHFRGFAAAALRAAGVAASELLPLTGEALLRRAVRECDAGPWSRLIDLRPGAFQRLAAAVRDLREAGLAADDVDAVARTETDRELAQVYRRYVAALDAAERRGIYDSAGIVVAASRHVAPALTGDGVAIVHGAYELTGVVLDLLRAIDAVLPVTVLLPGDPAAPAGVYGARFARAHLASPGVGLRRIETEAGVLPLEVLFDEAARPAPAPAGFLRCRHAQGAAAEVAIAVREALADVAAGVPPHEIVIAARRLEPFAAALEAALDDAELPWTSSLGTPLEREPLARDFLSLLRVVGEDFPRRATAELLRAPQRDPARVAGTDALRLGDRVDGWSRAAGLIGGLDEWLEALNAPEPDRRETEESEFAPTDATWRAGLARTLRGLERRIAPGEARRWSDAATSLRETLDAWLIADERDGETAAALHGLLDGMEQLETVAGDTTLVPFERVRAWLDDAVARTKLTPRRIDRGGLRVLDAMQLRGVTCRRLHLLGMNSGEFPSPPREDPLLHDALRARLAERSGRPLPPKAAGLDEERLLLAMTLGCASERVDVSWQRSDETGRSRTPSLALREIARLAVGRSDIDALEPLRAFPSHPLARLEAFAADPGLLSADEALLRQALASSGPDDPGLAAYAPQLAPGLAMLRATESYVTIDARYDAVTAQPANVGHGRGPTAAETLGSCPLRWFLRHVAAVPEPHDEVDAFGRSAADAGRRVHGVLERLYSELQRAGLFAEGRADEAIRTALGRLEADWDAELDAVDRRRARRLPVLWNVEREAWLAALRRFVSADLRRIADEGWREVKLEERIEAVVELGGEMDWPLVAVLDRRLERPDGAQLIGDYKTSVHLAERVHETEMLRGLALQVPLYALATGERGAVELLGVGPAFENAESTRFTFAGFSSAATREGLLETLRVLRALVVGGRFPLREGRHCEWCPYRDACRRTHPPTEERLARDPAHRDYYRLQSKNKSQRPRFADFESNAGEDR